MTTIAALVIAAGPWTSAPPQPAELHARPSLVAETPAAAAGETLWLALDFEIEPGWHTYWPGQNDSGFALDAEFTCSGNATVGEPLWPAPKRYSPAEGILDHVFEERMTVLVPVEVAGTAEPGSAVQVEADLRWLVCESMCIAESAVVSVSVPVSAAPAEPSPNHAVLFRAARDRLPREPSPEDQLRIQGASDSLLLGSSGAARLAFYPLDEGRRARNLIEDGLREGDSLELEFRPGDDPIRGVLEVWRSPDGPSSLFKIEWPDPRDAEQVGTGG